MSKIIGNTTATPVPRSDWAQTDKAKADFIRNKPDLASLEENVEKKSQVQIITWEDDD